MKSLAVFNTHEINPSLLIFSEPQQEAPVSIAHQYGHIANLKSRTFKLEDFALKSTYGTNSELLFISKVKICWVYMCVRVRTLKLQE